MKPLVYVASPYTRGHNGWNVHFQARTFKRLLDDKLVTPIAPLWSHLQELILPQPYEDWLSYDFELIERCDALMRLNAELPEVNYSISESLGADRELAHARSLGLPTFFSIEELYKWVTDQQA
jgi:hypothetical protein